MASIIRQGIDDAALVVKGKVNQALSNANQQIIKDPYNIGNVVNSIGSEVSKLRTNPETIGANTQTISDPTPLSTETQDPDILKIINDMKEAQKQSRYSALDSAYKSSLGSLADEEAGIKPRYYNAKNQVAAQSDIGALNFAQRAASMGIKGNAAQMPEIYRNASLQGNIGNLDAQEQAAYDTINRNRSTLAEKYNADKTGIGADIDAQSMQAYINQINADRAYNLDKTNMDRSYALNEAGLTGTYNGQSTLAAQNQQFNQNMSNQQFEYQKQQDAINLSYQQQRDKIEDQFKQGQLTLQQKEFALKQIEADRDYKLNQAQVNIQQQNANTSAANAAADNQLQRDRLTYEQQQDTANQATQTYNNYLSMGKDMINSGTSYGGTFTPRYTNQQVIDWISGLSLSAAEKAKLANDLGV